jgi:hypothetical protein
MPFPMHSADHVHEDSIRIFQRCPVCGSETAAKNIPDPKQTRASVPI